MNSLEEESRRRKCKTSDKIDLLPMTHSQSERDAFTCVSGKRCKIFLLCLMCVCVCVDICLCVSPDGNDCRAERGHMVMWHDSGPMLTRQNCDLRLRVLQTQPPEIFCERQFVYIEAGDIFFFFMCALPHLRAELKKKHDSLPDFFIASPHSQKVKASVTSSNNVRLWACNVPEKTRGQWSRGGVSNLPAKRKCV